MQRAILVVDPNADRRERLRVLLTSNGSRMVGEAADPEEAMRLAAMRSPDAAVIVDDLGNGDGIHLASRLSTEHGVPAVLLASSPTPAAVARAAHSGVMAVLPMPVEPAILSTTLEVAVHRFQDLLALRREVGTLRRALEDRKLIERAKGLLMEAEEISEAEAYARIRKKSMDTQRPMIEIARAVILAADLSGRNQ